MKAKLEKVTSPYVKTLVFVTTERGLSVAVSTGHITNTCLASALRQGLRLGRRFVLRPGPKDW